MTGHFRLGALQLGDDPAVGQGQLHRSAGRRFSVDAGILVLALHHYIARGVPDLVAEVAVTLDPAHVELDVTPGGGQRQVGKAQGVGTVGGNALGEFGAGLLLDGRSQLGLHHAAGALLHQGFQIDTVDDIQRVQYVALGLGHLLALAVAHQTMHIDGLERNLRAAVLMLHQMHGQHDHARHPEEDDVEAGHQHIGGVEGLQRLGLLRPAQGGEGPQARAEPGVQHVVVLAQYRIAQIVLRAYLGLVAADIDVARLVIPRRNAVAPPQLAGNTPVLNVTHPGEIHVFVLLGHELDAAVFHGGNGRLGQRLGGHIPLVGQPGLDHHAGAIALGRLQAVRLDLLQQAGGVEVLDNALARLEAVQPCIGGG